MKENKCRLFVDMDGTLAIFTPAESIEVLYEQGYFSKLKPMQNTLDAIKNIATSNENIEVFILSSVLWDSKYAMQEKNAWLDNFLPEVDKQHRIFLPCGENKRAYIPNGIRESDVLIDDYTLNLTAWEPPAKGIKILNGINHTKGTWSGNRIRHDNPSQVIANSIMQIALHNQHCHELPPQNDMPIRERLALAQELSNLQGKLTPQTKGKDIER